MVFDCVGMYVLAHEYICVFIVIKHACTCVYACVSIYMRMHTSMYPFDQEIVWAYFES